MKYQRAVFFVIKDSNHIYFNIYITRHFFRFKNFKKARAVKVSHPKFSVQKISHLYNLTQLKIKAVT